MINYQLKNDKKKYIERIININYSAVAEIMNCSDNLSVNVNCKELKKIEK